jgi:hypothetical protein
MLQTKTKTFARLTNGNWDNGGTIEVANESDAVAQALARHAICFTTFDVTSVTLNGQEMNGAPQNVTPRRYIGVDRIYTTAEVVAEMEAAFQEETEAVARKGKISPDEKEWLMISLSAFRSVIGEYKKKSPSAAHITGLERPGEFIELKEGEKVFDRQGRQLWPKPAAPKAAPKPPAP